MILVVHNPEDVKDFVGYIKAELSHAINKLLNRPPSSIWEEGYDSPILLDAWTTLKYIKYIYTNPQRSSLVHSIDEYPGVSSWEMYCSSQHISSIPWIRRRHILALPKNRLELSEQEQFTQKQLTFTTIYYDFTLYPNEWLTCFEESRNWYPEEIKAGLLHDIRQTEARLTKQRKGSPIGAIRLRLQGISLAFRPTKYSKRMYCLSVSRDLRKRFMLWFRTRQFHAAVIYRRWTLGDTKALYPPELFPPSVPRRANQNPIFTW